jgi:hypothetical protein
MNSKRTISTRSLTSEAICSQSQIFLSKLNTMQNVADQLQQFTFYDDTDPESNYNTCVTGSKINTTLHGGFVFPFPIFQSIPVTDMHSMGMRNATRIFR